MDARKRRYKNSAPPAVPVECEHDSTTARSCTRPEIKLQHCANAGELNMGILKVQQKRIEDRCKTRERLEKELVIRKEQLEASQTGREAILKLICQHWNQLNKELDVRVVLQSGKYSESPMNTLFLPSASVRNQLGTIGELDNASPTSTNAVAKILQVYAELEEHSATNTKIIESSKCPVNLIEALRKAYVNLKHENCQLHAFNVKLHSKYQRASLETGQATDKLVLEIMKDDELHRRTQELSSQIQKLVLTNNALIDNIEDWRQRVVELQTNSGSEETKGHISNTKEDASACEDGILELLQMENAELKKMVQDREAEFDDLQQKQNQAVTEIEQLKMDYNRDLPEDMISETIPFKSLQFKVSALNEELNSLHNFGNWRELSLHLNSNTGRNYQEGYSYVGPMSIMGVGEDHLQKLRADRQNLGNHYELVKEAYNNLSGNCENYKRHSSETSRLYGEMCDKIQELLYSNLLETQKVENYSRQSNAIEVQIREIKVERNEMLASLDALNKEESLRIQGRNEVSNAALLESCNDAIANLKIGMKHTQIPEETELGVDECTRDLETRLKNAVSNTSEMKTIIKTYKESSNDLKEKVELAISEKKHQDEIKELKALIKSYQEPNREKRRFAENDKLKQIQNLQAQIHKLKECSKKIEVDNHSLIHDKEVTNLALNDAHSVASKHFDALFDKNSTILKAKEEQLIGYVAQESLEAEKERSINTINLYNEQLKHHPFVVKHLEGRVENYLAHINEAEKEIERRFQASEAFKFKAIENARSVAESEVDLQKAVAQVVEAQRTAIELMDALEAQAYKIRRLEEELTTLKAKEERLNTTRTTDSTEDSLPNAERTEELRELKESLTCPSCKVSRKDTVFTQCFHVFCLNCIRTRYETRQRKCPKCNAPFGANDYHRLHLTASVRVRSRR